MSAFDPSMVPGATRFGVPDAGFLDLPPERRAEDAAAAVIPVPYDKTSTWVKGADLGPAALLGASAQVEWYEIERDVEPSVHGVVTRPPILCDGPPEEMTTLVRTGVAAELKAGKMPIVIGGEHSVSIGAIDAAAEMYPALTVLQIDAHADTREAYQGSTRSHACVMARARERCGIVQVGIRSMDASERAGLDPDRVIYAHEIDTSARREWIGRVLDQLTDHIYITLDVDGFDPSVVPCTGTPEPGGLTWWDFADLVDAVGARSRIVGFDVVELCPVGELWHASAFVAARATQRMVAAALTAPSGSPAPSRPRPDSSRSA
ncbi:MAG: agmatinase [Planctomycetota bacterium]